MPQYKITYFPIRGLAENARQLFALAGVEYENATVLLADWPQYKPSTPFGKLPVLEVDGKPLAQSVAIYRYLAREFGFAGANAWESAQLDALADQFQEHLGFFNKTHPYYVVLGGFMEGDKDQLFHDLIEPARDEFFPVATRYLKENPSGFLVGDKVSWVDTMFSEHVAAFEERYPGYASKYPEVLAHMEKVRSIPELKSWLEKRPVTVS